MRILVTGSSGLVGGAIARRLVEEGHEVVGLSRRSSANLPGEVQQVQGDIAALSFREAVGGVAPCQAVVHAAASRDYRDDASEISLTNGLGTQQVVALARTWAAEHFVYISGITVIGRPVDLPITEDHATHPLTAYHASKLYGEHLVEIACRAGPAGAILRLTAPVGPGTPDNRILSIFVRRALDNAPITLHGQGLRRQDYVDVRDVGLAVGDCIEQRVAGVYNIAGGRAVSNRELAEQCIRRLDSTSAITFSGRPDPDDDVVWDVSIDKASAAFDYSPRHTLDVSIDAVAAGLRPQAPETA